MLYKLLCAGNQDQCEFAKLPLYVKFLELATSIEQQASVWHYRFACTLVDSSTKINNCFFFTFLAALSYMGEFKSLV